MTSPSTCTCGTVHMDACAGPMTLCIPTGFVWDAAYRKVTKLGSDSDWPVGTQVRIRFSWGTGTELIIPGTVDGPYLRFHMDADETELLPRGTRATIDLNYDAGDPVMWRPWRTGGIGGC